MAQLNRRRQAPRGWADVQRACIALPHSSIAAGCELAHGAAQIAAL